MGYRSQFSGSLTIKKGKLTALKKFLKSEEIDEIDIDGNELVLSQGEWKMCYTRKFFEELVTLVDGELDVSGEDEGDLWKIKLEKGKIYISASRVEYLPYTSDDRTVTDFLGEIPKKGD